MKILVTGGGFTNKGAEAMLLAVSRFFKRRFPNCEILHHSEHESWRAPMLKAGITPLPPLPYVSRKARIPEFLRTLLFPGCRSTRIGLTIDRYAGMDGIVDVSGFKSTDQMADNDERWWETHQLKSLRAPIVFLPQAWGPFRCFNSRMYTRALLRDIPLVFARDRQSLRHLRSLQILSNGALRLASDVAFQFPASPTDVARGILESVGVSAADGPLIGIAPNMMVYKRVPGEGPDNRYVQALAAICGHLIRRSNATVVVIPHHIWKGDKLDDRFIGKSLAEMGTFGDHLRVIDRDYDSADLKAVIGQLDFLVASRFHSLVAALSMRVPLVVVGWSHKYVELMRDVGLSQYVLSVREVRDGSIGALKVGWKKRDQLKASLLKHVPRLEKSSAHALELAAQVIASAQVTT